MPTTLLAASCSIDEFARFVDHRLDLVGVLRQQVLYLVQDSHAYRFLPRAWPQYPLVNPTCRGAVDCNQPLEPVGKSPKAGCRCYPPARAASSSVVSLPSLRPRGISPMLISRTMMGVIAESVGAVVSIDRPTICTTNHPTAHGRSPGPRGDPLYRVRHTPRTRYPPLNTRQNVLGLLPAPDRRLRPPRPAPRQDQPYRSHQWPPGCTTPQRPRIARTAGANARRFAVIATLSVSHRASCFGSTTSPQWSPHPPRQPPARLTSSPGSRHPAGTSPAPAEG